MRDLRSKARMSIGSTRIREPTQTVFHCPKCAAENPDDARYCRKCGFQIVKAEQPEKQPRTGAVDKFFRWIGYIVVFMLVVAILNHC